MKRCVNEIKMGFVSRNAKTMPCREAVILQCPPAEARGPIPFPDGICPLCSGVFTREQLHDHISLERPHLRNSTIKAIQARHLSWLEEHGACQSCWSSFCNKCRFKWKEREIL